MMINPHVKYYPLDEVGAECEIAPFQHPERAQFIEIDARPGEGVTVQRLQNWDRTRFTWKRKKLSSPLVLELSMPCCVALRHFDRFVANFWADPNLTVTLHVRTDAGEFDIADRLAGAIGRIEVEGAIGGTELREVQMKLSGAAGREAMVDLVWFGLAHAESVARAQSQQLPWSPEWPGCFDQAADFSKTQFVRGILFGEEDISRLQQKMEEPGWRGPYARFLARVEKCRPRDIESEIGLYPPWSDTRYSRMREESRVPYFHEGLDVGFAAIMTGDESLARLAVRYLLAITHCRHWYVSAELDLWGDAWDKRCFIQEMMATTAAVLFDWFGHVLNVSTREYVVQALWDKGLAVIERDLMKWDYMHHINQGPWFCRARILAGLILEKEWPHVGNYVDRAAEEMRQDMNRYILEDGGVDEGVGYFCMTWHAVLPAALAYVRARGHDIHDWLPPQAARCEAYIATMSGSRPGTLLLDGDNTSEVFRGEGAAVLAGVYPGSVYDKVLAEALKEKEFSYYDQYMNTSLFGFIFGPDKIEPSVCVVPEFSLLPRTGQATSRRLGKNHSLRLHVGGCKARPSHSHLDKGAFLLEVDDDTVLIDRGTVRYDDWRVMMLYRSHFHNVLTPAAIDGEVPGQNPPGVDMIPQAEGDAQRFRAVMDLRPVWGDWFRRLTSESSIHRMPRISLCAIVAS